MFIDKKWIVDENNTNCSHVDGECTQTATAKVVRPISVCDSEKTIYNNNIDAQIENLRSLDINTEIETLTALKKA